MTLMKCLASLGICLPHATQGAGDTTFRMRAFHPNCKKTASFGSGSTNCSSLSKEFVIEFVNKTES